MDGPRLTVLSFGGGQDSTAILYRLALDRIFRAIYAPHDLLVLMSDTGDERVETYLHILFVRGFCEERGIPFFFIRPEMGFHPNNWWSLRANFERYDTVMTTTFKKACTDNLKIKPIYAFLNEWIAQQYGLANYGTIYKTKSAIVQFAQRFGKIMMLLGIAKGEEGRVADSKFVPPAWQRLSVTKQYPLMEIGWGRSECQEYIRKTGLPLPPPSNCLLCPYQSKQELLLLARKHPADFAAWATYERRKLRKFRHKGEANYCVLHKRKTLNEMLAEAEREYGHWTLEELEAYRFSHGHCVKSAY